VDARHDLGVAPSQSRGDLPSGKLLEQTGNVVDGFKRLRGLLGLDLRRQFHVFIGAAGLFRVDGLVTPVFGLFAAWLC
jgi:hypothetical protein